MINSLKILKYYHKPVPSPISLNCSQLLFHHLASHTPALRHIPYLLQHSPCLSDHLKHARLCCGWLPSSSNHLDHQVKQVTCQTTCGKNNKAFYHAAGRSANKMKFSIPRNNKWHSWQHCCFPTQLNKQALKLQHKIYTQHLKFSAWQFKIKLCQD